MSSSIRVGWLLGIAAGRGAALAGAPVCFCGAGAAVDWVGSFCEVSQASELADFRVIRARNSLRGWPLPDFSVEKNWSLMVQPTMSSSSGRLLNASRSALPNAVYAFERR